MSIISSVGKWEIFMRNKTEFIVTLTVVLLALLGAIAVSLNAITLLFG